MQITRTPSTPQLARTGSAQPPAAPAAPPAADKPGDSVEISTSGPSWSSTASPARGAASVALGLAGYLPGLVCGLPTGPLGFLIGANVCQGARDGKAPDPYSCGVKTALKDNFAGGFYHGSMVGMVGFGGYLLGGATGAAVGVAGSALALGGLMSAINYELGAHRSPSAPLFSWNDPA